MEQYYYGLDLDINTQQNKNEQMVKRTHIYRNIQYIYLHTIKKHIDMC